MSAIDPKYCPTCGASLSVQLFDGREQAYCSACDEHVFHLPSPAAGVAVVRNDEILLVHRAGRQYGGTWAIPGGLIEWNESPREAAVRELAEETVAEAAPEHLALLDASRLEGPRGEFSSIKLNYAILYGETVGELSPGDDVQEAQFWTVNGIDQSNEELRPGNGHGFTKHSTGQPRIGDYRVAGFRAVGARWRASRGEPAACEG